MKNDRCIPGGQRSFWVLCMHTMRYRQALRMALRVSATGIFQNSQHTVWGILQFNPISNVGGGHLSLNRCGIACEFQSTSPVWGMTAVDADGTEIYEISIHIPRVGDDLRARAKSFGRVAISIHIPRVGDDTEWLLKRLKLETFQSTSPVWGMT